MGNKRYQLVRIRDAIVATGIVVFCVGTPSGAGADTGKNCRTGGGPSVERQLPNTTQGPFWPPAEVVNAEGDFILVGQVLTEVAPNIVAPVPSQAVLVSKETVPALDENGKEDADNWFGAPYRVIRPLDLTPGSEDMETVLYSNSFGPAAGDFGRAPRIPRLGDSAYNLNGDLVICPEVFPSASQKFTYTRARFPLHEAPILGFQGDNVSYDIDTGEPFDPRTTTGPGCELLVCPGEDAVDSRRTKPITLGEWLNGNGRMKIQLTGFDRQVGAYTHAHFTFKLRDMLPNSLYTVWAVRLRQIPIPGIFERRDIDPLAVPNVISTDTKGNAEVSFLVRNPFPDPATDATGKRIIGISVIYHSDQQTWGACFARFGPGVDVHATFSSLADGSTSLTDFITKEPTAGSCDG